MSLGEAVGVLIHLCRYVCVSDVTRTHCGTCFVFINRLVGLVVKVSASRAANQGFFGGFLFLFFCCCFLRSPVISLGSPLLGEIFAYVTVF